ncbi:Zn(2)-C6 fungal-specific transcription factor [Mucor lusitanicus]|uniref:Zn(2)-C6 fungal-specific transcription factor n=1 Tax=Mucor circinelloides f. lusitanicus TaxID=29924 RepID=A0A8H4F2U6_MUCCL|nr:Zn(2)-C6 fungal-specific transcription factor [Mucor lusitanicus]
MATKRKGKTVPCEGCRERKKKCTAGQPCERCKRLGIQCYYLKPVAPPKLESIESVNHQEIQMHVEVLEDIMRNMEREMYLLNATTTTTATATNRFFSQHEMTSNWQLKLGKDGGISINTDILSYANLLKHVEALGNLSNTIPIIKQPTLASLSAGGGYLHRNVLYTVVRRGNFRAILGCIQNEARKQIISACTMTPPPSAAAQQQPFVVFEKKDLALQLVNAYFGCRFLHRVVFHQKTFFDMFVKGRSDLEASPVVCAVAAAVLTMHCKHVIACVPYDQQLGLGEYYFDKARYAVSLQFDEPSMETMIAYLFMSLYKSNLLRPQDANMYLEIAIRIRQILAETVYKHPPPLPIYSTQPNTRLHAGFQDCVQFIQFINNQRGVPAKNLNPSRNKPSMLNQENSTFKQLFQEICAETYDPKPLPDESRQTVRAILKEHYVGRIARVVGPYFRRVRWSETDLIPLSFLMKTEEDLNQLYFCQIPLDFRLAPSIFEDGISDAEFRKRLLEDGRTDINSVTIAARYYQSLLALHEPFQPTIRRSQEGDANVLSVHALRAQEVCYKCSIIVVRLLEFQCTILEACTIPTPSLLCAWDTLMRNSCLGMDQDDLDAAGVTNYLSAKDIELAREYAVRCIEVLRRGYLFNGAEREVFEYYEKIETQLLTALCKSASPTAKYWEPVSNW